jgi:hypothetical protein
MKKLLFIAFALATSQAFAAYTTGKSLRELQQEEKTAEATKNQQEASLLQTLSNLPVFAKLKNQLSEQYPGLFDSLAAGDVSGLLTILGNKLQNVISSSFQDLQPAIQDLKPANITIADLRKLKTALDNYAKGLLGGDESVNPQLKQIFNSAKDAYKDLVKKENIFSNVVSKDFPTSHGHGPKDFLEKLYYNIIEGEESKSRIPENEVRMTSKATPSQELQQPSILDTLKNVFGL